MLMVSLGSTVTTTKKYVTGVRLGSHAACIVNCVCREPLSYSTSSCGAWRNLALDDEHTKAFAAVGPIEAVVYAEGRIC